MKKTYSRPLAVFESYQLDAAIAIQCSVPIGNTTYQCSVDLSAGGKYGYGGGGEFFNYYNCQTDLVGDGPDGDSVCYHGPYSAIDIYAIFLNS